MNELDLFRRWRNRTYGCPSQQEFIEIDQFKAWQARAKIANQRIRKLEETLKELKDAVKVLPVEEWVEQDIDGEPCLVGYKMQAREEWERIKELLENTDEQK